MAKLCLLGEVIRIVSLLWLDICQKSKLDKSIQCHFTFSLIALSSSSSVVEVVNSSGAVVEVVSSSVVVVEVVGSCVVVVVVVGS